MDLVKKLPEDTSLREIVREIELIAGIREAREEAARGQGTPSAGSATARECVDIPVIITPTALGDLDL